MATTLATSPTYPAAGDTVTLSAAGATGDVVVFEVTSQPSGSANTLGFVTKGLSVAASGDLQNSAQSVANAEAQGDEYVPDVAGDYTIRIWEFRSFVGYTAGFAGDPAADERLDLLAATDHTLKVGELMDLPMRTQRGDGADLRFVVVEDTIRAATVENLTGEAARLAALDATLVAALAATVGTAAATVGTALQSGVNDLRTNYEAHRVDAGHAGAATDTTFAVLLTGAGSQEGAIEVLNALRQALVGHLTQANSVEATSWHTDDDLKNLPLAAEATNVKTATVLSADLRERVYERHRAEGPTIHDTADATNVLAAPSLLDDVIAAFFDALAEAAPTAPTGESQGVIDLINRYGFDKPNT